MDVSAPGHCVRQASLLDSSQEGCQDHRSRLDLSQDLQLIIHNSPAGVVFQLFHHCFSHHEVFAAKLFWIKFKLPCSDFSFVVAPRMAKKGLLILNLPYLPANLWEGSLNHGEMVTVVAIALKLQVNQGINKWKSVRNLRSIAEERVGRKCGSLRVLNSYWVAADPLFFVFLNGGWWFCG